MALYYQGAIFELPDINNNINRSCAQNSKRSKDCMLEADNQEKYKQQLYGGEKKICYLDFHHELINRLEKVNADEELFSLSVLDSDEVVFQNMSFEEPDEVVFQGTSVEDSNEVVHNKLIAKLLWIVHS
jgi:hypothetical protein